MARACSATRRRSPAAPPLRPPPEPQHAHARGLEVLEGQRDEQPAPMIGVAFGRRLRDGRPHALAEDPGQDVHEVRRHPQRDGVARPSGLELRAPVRPERRQVEPLGSARRVVHDGRVGETRHAEDADPGRRVGPGGAGRRRGARCRRDGTRRGRECHQVPHGRLRHEPQRVDHAPADAAVASSVHQAQPPVPPQRVVQHREVGRRLVGLPPLGRVEVHARPSPRRFGHRGGGERGRQLAQRGGQHPPHAEVRQRPRHRAQQQGAGLGAVERGQIQPVAIRQRHAAARTGVGEDRHARDAQRVEVAQHRAARDLQPCRSSRVVMRPRACSSRTSAISRSARTQPLPPEVSPG